MGVNLPEGLEALRQLSHEYDQLQPVLARRKESDPLSVARIPALAEATYRQGMSVLEDALALTQVIRSSDQQNLEQEVTQIEAEIDLLSGIEAEAGRVKLLEGTVTSHKERLEMIRQQELEVDKFLRQSDRCEASLHLTRMELASLQAERSDTSVGEVAETLLRTIEEAREVQDELKRLGY